MKIKEFTLVKMVSQCMLMICVWVALCCGAVGGERILAVLPMPSRSHSILLERMITQLCYNGHQVTYIAATPPTKTIPNLTVVYVPGIRDAALSAIPGMKNSSNILTVRRTNPWLAVLFGHKMGEMISEHILSFPAVKTLIAEESQFDLVLGEIMMDESILAGFAYKYKAPIVAFATTMPMFSVNYMARNVAPSSYVPDLFLGYSSKMTFWQRFNNFFYGLAVEMNYRLRGLPAHDRIMRQHFGGDLPYIGDIISNTSLVLVNHHHALGFPRPYTQNMVEVAGVHIDHPKPLPQELESLMNKSGDGVILFSLGTNFNSSDLPAAKISALVEGFSRLPLQIIWKFEKEIENLPPNVKVMRWLPQNDILAHRNLKIFVTHGGLLSTTEAMARGVPVVGIPLMGDQHLNMKQVEEAGWGCVLDYDLITSDNVYNVINRVISDPRYRELAAKKSELLLDRPMSALDTALWWIEYVLRHEGASHLLTAAHQLEWYQLYLLDVFALLSLLATLVTALIYCFFIQLIRFIRPTCT